MEKIISLNPTDPGWPDDIGFDEKSKEEIKSLYHKVLQDQVKKQLKDVLFNNCNYNQNGQNIIEV